MLLGDLCGWDSRQADPDASTDCIRGSDHQGVGTIWN